MQTMTETLMALPSQDNGLARRLLQRAQGAFQKWPEGFVGFCAQLQCRTNGRNASGWLQVSSRQRVAVHLPDPDLRCLAQTMLMRLVDERTPRFFKDGDGRYPITLDAEHAHPFGKRIQVHRRDGERLAYWIDTAGRIRYVEREGEGKRMVMAFEEYTRATPGRVLPTRVTTAWFDIESGVCIRSETIIYTHRLVGYVWLPATQQVTITERNATQTILLAFDAHTLKVNYQESIEEMQHADQLIQRLLFLEGVPNLSDYDPILVGGTVREQIDNDLALEMGALAVLRPGIQLCVEAGDYATRELLACILKDEEHDVDWLEAQKHKINEVGYDGYLAQQIYHRD